MNSPAGTDSPLSPHDFVASSSLSVHTLPDGTRLLDYEILGLIGEGGFGIVYLAHDHSLGRRVAIKEYMPAAMATRTNSSTAVVVKSARHDEAFRLGLKSFVNEARLLARFDHPALVKVYRFWEQNGTAYMVMPYYQGATLKATLANLGRPPTEAELRAWMRPLLDALAVMHAVNCFHRDIAPDNILLTRSGPLLLDFGAARHVIADMTHAPTVVLKPGYAPIEQYGEVPSLTQGPWTDLYALASVVHGAISGKTPYSSVERLMDDRHVPLALLLEREPARFGPFKPTFVHAIDAALHLKPQDRPQDVAAFLRLLEGRARDPAPALGVASTMGAGDAMPHDRAIAPPAAEPATTDPAAADAPAAAAPSAWKSAAAPPVAAPPAVAPSAAAPRSATPPGTRPITPPFAAPVWPVRSASVEPTAHMPLVIGGTLAAVVALMFAWWYGVGAQSRLLQFPDLPAVKAPAPSLNPAPGATTGTASVPPRLEAPAGAAPDPVSGLPPEGGRAPTLAQEQAPAATGTAGAGPRQSAPASPPTIKDAPLNEEPAAAGPPTASIGRPARSAAATDAATPPPAADAAPPNHPSRARREPRAAPAQAAPHDAPAQVAPRDTPARVAPRDAPEDAPSPTNAAATRAKCSDILQKASLEPLTPGEAAYLKRECR